MIDKSNVDLSTKGESYVTSEIQELTFVQSQKKRQKLFSDQQDNPISLAHSPAIGKLHSQSNISVTKFSIEEKIYHTQ